tara:strand:+ start:4141 stop:5331 length:1191 start_codon:yes stop_codon:yes gene_type:complete
MSVIRTLKDNINILNKRVILRSDLNVPIIKNEIQDTTRIKLCLPFLETLLKQGAKVLLISHLGRPKNSNDKNYSLEPVFKYLKKNIKNNIFFHSEKINSETKKKISFLKQGEIILFENIRLNDGEIQNDDGFAKNLSSIGDIYINDAFSCSHRKQASVHKVTEYLKETYGGPSLIKEVDSLNLIMNNKQKPVTCIIGGSKVSTKLGVIISLIQKVDNLVIVGAMANNFIKYKGLKFGKSLIEKDSEKTISKIYDQLNNSACKIILPTDFVVSNNINGTPIAKNQENIEDEDIILDIGVETLKKIHMTINNSKTVMWNGPAGYFENKKFAKGTIAIAEMITDNTMRKSLTSIVGGGDTVSAIKNSGLNANFTHLSTAGGAFLEYIEGKNLPGIEVLK